MRTNVPEQDWQGMALQGLPYLAGAAVPMARPLAAMRGLPGLLARISAAGGAGAATQAATIPARAAMGRPTPSSLMEGLSEAGRAGATQAGAQVFGEAASPLLRKMSLRVMESALRVPKEAERIYQKSAARPTATRAGVEPSTPAAAVKHGVVLGGSTNPRGTQRVARLREASAGRTDEILGEQTRSGVTYRPTDPAIADEITALKESMAPRADRQKAIEQIDALWREFIEGRRAKASPGRLGKLQRLSPQELNAVKQSAQKEAKRIYEAKPAGPRANLRAEFNEALALGARKALEREDERIAQASGILPQLGRQNALTGELSGLEGAVGAREMTPRGFGGQRWLVDPRLYLENPTIGSFLSSRVLGNAPGPTLPSQVLPRAAGYLGEMMWPETEPPPWAR